MCPLFMFLVSFETQILEDFGLGERFRRFGDPDGDLDLLDFVNRSRDLDRDVLLPLEDDDRLFLALGGGDFETLLLLDFFSGSSALASLLASPLAFLFSLALELTLLLLEALLLREELPDEELDDPEEPVELDLELLLPEEELSRQETRTRTKTPGS